MATTKPTNRNTVLVTEEAQAAYASLINHSVQWRTYIQTLPGTSPHDPWLVEDLFHALYLSNVQLNPGVSAALHRNFAIMAALLPMADFRRLRQHTEGDVVAAAMAARRFADDLLAEQTDGGVDKGPNRPAWLNSLAGLRFDWTRRRNGREKWVTHPVDVGAEASQPGRGDREQIPRNGYSHHRVYKALEAASRKTLRDRQLRSAWGIEPGIRSVRSLDYIWAMVDEVRSLPGFAALTEVFLDMRQLMQPAAKGRRRRRPGARGFERLEGWTRGEDLDRIAPEELVRLLDEDMRSLFYEAYEHRRLLQERYGGRQPETAGPLVCCLDVSRSMNKIVARGRERFVWAKGIGLALLDVARQTERPYLGVCFSSEHDLATFEVPPGGYDPKIAIALAECDFDGGTHFRAPLLQAIQYLRQHHAGGPARPGARRGSRGPGQIVFVTDGEAVLPDTFATRFNNARQSLGFQLFTVFIDGQQPELVALSDRVFSVDDGLIESWERATAGLARAIRAAR